MKNFILTALKLHIFIYLIVQSMADDPIPGGLESVIHNPNIPIIIDATVMEYNQNGHGKIQINKIIKRGNNNPKSGIPKWIRGYGYEGSEKIAPLKIVLGGKTGRYLFFLKGDQLFSTYNNRFPIRKNEKGTIEVGYGFNGSGAPWKPLKEAIKPLTMKNKLKRN